MKAGRTLAAALLKLGCQAGLNTERDAAALNLEPGAAYLAQGRPALARDKLRATRHDPGSAEAHRVLGMAYERLEDRDRAGRHYRRAVLPAPGDAEALNSPGVFQCRRAEEPREGLKMLERAAREAVGIRRASIYANRGVCEWPLDRNSAAEWFPRALALDPRHVEAQLALERLAPQN